MKEEIFSTEHIDDIPKSLLSEIKDSRKITRQAKAFNLARMRGYINCNELIVSFYRVYGICLKRPQAECLLYQLKKKNLLKCSRGRYEVINAMGGHK